MKYRVQVTTSAQSDADAAYEWLAERTTHAAACSMDWSMQLKANSTGWNARENTSEITRVASLSDLMCGICDTTDAISLSHSSAGAPPLINPYGSHR
ncbi:MAG TPA: hypothetical protein VHX86_03005 [Tepidisphaeraceae bacterium]|nr:hypothetical protein [Tepidisphaeraceae bacterium]